MDMSLLIPKKDNLVTYFILPLLNINKSIFGRTYSAAYISESDIVYVKLKKDMISPIYKLNPNFISATIINSTLYCLFRMPINKVEDLNRFKKGEYSKFTRESKKLIYTMSTLPYNKTMSDFKISHPILHALDSTKLLRKTLIDFLNVEVLSDTGELINPPDESWYIEYRLNLK